jgi:hypothetical protein
MSRSVKKSCTTKLLEFFDAEVSCENPQLVSLLLYLQKISHGSFGKLLLSNRENPKQFLDDLFEKEFFREPNNVCWNREFVSEIRFGDTAISDVACDAISLLRKTYSVNLATIVNDLDHTEIVAEDIVYAFEYLSDKEKRQKDGSFYTNAKIANLLFKPLFLDELRRDFANSSVVTIEKLCKWRFLDPACGCGSILLEVKRSLIALLEEIRISVSFVTGVDLVGFEIDKKAACCAELALRVLDSEHDLKTQNQGYIACGNSLLMDWQEHGDFDFIVGNPPFWGGSKLSDSQIADVKRSWGHLYKPEMDYVSCWFRLTSDYIEKRPTTKAAFITTNSITQGSQLSCIWPPLLGTIRLTFAYESFRWDSTMVVNVVIVGFESRKSSAPYKPVLYQVEEANAAEKRFLRIELKMELAPHLQPNVPFVELSKRTTNISPKAPKIYAGAQIQDTSDTDGFTLKLKDVEAVHEKSRTALTFIRPQVAAKELLSGDEIYYLDLDQAASVPAVFADRVKHIEEFRRASTTRDAARLARTPHLWGANFTICNYKIIVVPAVSSKNYAILPVALVNPQEYQFPYSYAVCNSTVYYIEDGTLYNFGIVQSSMHRAWVHGLCGTNGESTRYNAQLYKTFVWPSQNQQQPAFVDAVKNAASAILDYRRKAKSDASKEKGSLHDLYCGEMAAPLAALHKKLDESVEVLYGAKEAFAGDGQRLAFLIDLYNKEIGNEFGSKKRQISLTEMFAKKPKPPKDE